MKTAYAHLDDFCKLPEKTKEMYLRNGAENHGYVKPGQEKFDGVTKDIRHAYNICTLNAPLPDEPLPGFKQHIAEIAKDFKNLSALLLQALGYEEDELLNETFLSKVVYGPDQNLTLAFRAEIWSGKPYKFQESIHPKTKAGPQTRTGPVWFRFS